MNRQPLTPAQIIEKARQNLAKARTPEGLRFDELTSIGMLDTLNDLQLIDLDTRRTLRAEFDQLADSRRALIAGGAQ